MSNQRATIKDVAKLAGVGISVVSYVLNETPGKTLPPETRKKVQDAACQLHYIPNNIARGMRLKKTMTIGIISFWSVEEKVFVDILSGALEYTQKNNYSILLCNNDKEYDYIDYYFRKQVDGFIFISSMDENEHFNEKSHIEFLKKNNIPFVVMNGHTYDKETNYIYINFYDSAYKATQYLVDLGHKKIGYIGADKINSFQNHERQRAFIDALKENGYELTFLYTPNDIPDILCDINDGKSDITALVTNKSDIAQKVLDAAIDMNLEVPERLSVIASNTHAYSAYLHPPLTSVEIPTKEMGSEAANLLLQLIDDKKICKQMMLSCKVSQRKSCKKI